jgi:cobalt-zinc-cadmium efflux system outer membrane protein
VKWLASLLALSACAPHDAGFGDVRRTVADRTGRRVAWDPDDEAGPQAPPEVRRLLSRPLDADRAVQVALLHNHSLQASFERLGIARAELVQASLLPNPRLHAEIPIGAEAEGAAVLSVVDLVLMPARRAVASDELEATKLEVAGEVLDLGFETRVAFIQWQAAALSLDSRRSELEAAGAAFEAARTLHEAGNVTDLRLASEEAAFHEARLSTSDAEGQVVTARERLNVLLGLHGPDVEWTGESQLANPPAPPSSDGLERRAIVRSLDLAASKSRIEAAAGRVGIARVEGLVPDVEAGVTAHGTAGDVHVGPAVGLELPLFDQGEGEVGAAQARLRALRQEHIALAVRIRSAVRLAAEKVALLHDRAVFLGDAILPARRRVVAETLAAYDAMQAGVFELLAAKRAEIDAARRTTGALRDYWIARAELDQILAGRLVAIRDPADAAGAAPTAEGGH